MNPPRIHAITDPHSGRSLRADIRSVGDDIVIIIGGGTHPHVGAVVLACPVHSGGSDVSALIVKKHREEVPARSIAEKVCQACRQTTVVTLGIHEDDLDSRGIQDYLDLAEKMGRELSDLLNNR